MTIETALAGKWTLLVEEAPYDPDAPTTLCFDGGKVSDEGANIRV